MWWLFACQPSPPVESPPVVKVVVDPGLAILNSPPAGFVDVREAIPNLGLDVRFSSTNNPTGQRLPGYGAPGVWLRTEVAEALKQVVHNLETEQLGMVLYDAYRPVRAEMALAAWLQRTGHQHLVDSGFVRTETHHAVGTAVDVTLVHLPSGEPLDMGTPWGSFGKASAYEEAYWPQMENRTLLRNHMNQNGFRGVKYTWWHFYFPLNSAERRDVPYGCFEENEGEWSPPKGWHKPTYREEEGRRQTSCPDEGSAKETNDHTK